jgi:hypothetical protein
MSEVQTINRLQNLLKLYEQGFSSTRIDCAINKLVDIEIQQTETESQKLWQRLQHYEQQHQMTSAEFYRRFQAGELGDDMDMIEWSAFYDMYLATQRQLHLLRGL